MIDVNYAFFYFLRQGLWEAEETYAGDAPRREEWEQLFSLARAQAVTGMFIDGVARTAMRPPAAVWEQWVAHLVRMERTNEFIDRCGKAWLKRLGSRGIAASLFKGSSVAAWYLRPLHRSYGDIDIVVRRGWRRLKSMLAESGLACREEQGDIVVGKEGFQPVEFHSRWEFAYSPLANFRLQRMLRAADGSDRELYLACLILHLRRHFLTYGIGMKQVCDVAVMLRCSGLDTARLERILRRLHAAKFSRLLFGFIAAHLAGGRPLPLAPPAAGRGAALFSRVILTDGYGLKARQEAIVRGKRGPVAKSCANAAFWLRRGVRMAGIMPGEVCGFLLYLSKKRLKNLILCGFGSAPERKGRRPLASPLELAGNKALKRAFDVAFSLAVLLTVFPVLLAVVALVTECTMPGRLFFVQKRTGLNGKEFRCYKFRTMRKNAEADSLQATRSDLRITRWGHILRKTSLDEMPQFLNVLLGDMSVVGPRPHMVKQTEQFSRLIDGYMARHRVKPGITGWSQINGFRGETRTLVQMRNRIKYDIWYIRHWHFALDLYIVYKTVANTFRGDKNAY